MSGHGFSIVPGVWAVVRREARAPVPPWAWNSDAFVSLTRTADELSMVCPEAVVPPGERYEGSWALLRLRGPFPFAQVGVLASIAAPLAEAGIPLFALSTFDTDHVLIPRDRLTQAVQALVNAGHVFEGGDSLPA